MAEKEKLTVELDRETMRRAKSLAVDRGTTVSHLVASSIARMLDEESAYERARQRALAFLDEGFHMGGSIRATRDELHER